MAESERFDPESREYIANMVFRCCEQFLIDNLEKRGQLEPILEGYQGANLGPGEKAPAP